MNWRMLTCPAGARPDRISSSCQMHYNSFMIKLTPCMANRRGRRWAGALIALATLVSAAAASAQMTGDEGGTASSPMVSGVPATPTAQSALDSAMAYAAGAKQELDAIKLELDQIEATIQRQSADDAALSQLRASIDPLQQRASAVVGDVMPRIQSAEVRLKQLGPAPEDGKGGESELVKTERAEQNKILATYQGVAAQARVLVVRGEQLGARIGETRRALFTERIFERQASALSPKLWYDVAKAIPLLASRSALLLSDWWDNLQGKLGIFAKVSLTGAFVLIGLLWLPARRLLLRFGERDPGRAQPSQLRKTSAAAWLTLVYVLVPGAALFIVYTTLALLDLLPDRIENVVSSAFNAILFYSLVQGLAWAILAPSRATWRLVPLKDGETRRLLVLLLTTVAIFVIGEWLDDVNTVLFAPLAVAIGKELVVSVLIALFAGMALRIIINSRQQADAETAARLHWSWLFTIAWIGTISIFVAAISGFLSLASFIASQLVVGGTILASLMLVLKLTDAVLTEGLEGDTGPGARIAQFIGIRHQALVQIGLILSGLIRISLVLIAISLLAVPWGIESTDVFGWLKTGFFGFQVGDITISFSAILLGIGIFLTGVIITKSVQRWLDQSYLPRTKLDTGVRNSVKTGFGYLGVLLAAMAAITYVGLDLSNIAIVAGALSVGIGFGLQSIVNNFVSGLILLAERPIKAGDWVVAGGAEGYVRKISVRATEIETFDGATVIAPNSDLISSPVTNLMHGNNVGRIKVGVGVTYGADPEQVRKILLKCAEEHPGILRTPEPRVFFMNFGDSSLDFELRAHLANIDNGLSVRSDLRFAILAALRAEQIEIPFPQRDVNMHGLGQLEASIERLAAAIGKTADLAGAAKPASTAKKKGPPDT